MNRIDHYAIPCCLRSRGGRGNAIRGVKQALVVTGIVLFMEPGRQTEIRQLDVSIFVNEDVIRLDITGSDVSGVGGSNVLAPRTGE